MYALEQLRFLLQKHQVQFQRRHVATENESTQPVLSKAVSMLLLRCRDSDVRVRLAAAKCLGQIGAISPDRYAKICDLIQVCI